MVRLLATFLFGATVHYTWALPTSNERRTVTSLDQAAFAEAQQRDATATRAFSAVPIKTADGRCLFVDELSGDFRANLTPIQVANCDNSQGQQWDVITAGKHDDQPGTMLVVSALTQACFNFDPRRAAGNQVILFSCGGRADGGGLVTNSQLFNFTGSAGPRSFSPLNSPGTCFTVTSINVIDQATCNPNDSTQTFTFGQSGSTTTASNSTTTVTTAASVATTVAGTSTTSSAAASNTTSAASADTCEA